MKVIGFSKRDSSARRCASRARLALELALVAKRAAVLARQHVHEPEARVVARARVFGPGLPSPTIRSSRGAHRRRIESEQRTARRTSARRAESADSPGRTLDVRPCGASALLLAAFLLRGGSCLGVAFGAVAFASPPSRRQRPHLRRSSSGTSRRRRGSASTGVPTSSARGGWTATTGVVLAVLQRTSATPSGSWRSDRCFDLVQLHPCTSSSMNSGRSFGRQVTSTSVSSGATTPPCPSRPARRLALEVNRHVDADLLGPRRTRCKSRCMIAVARRMRCTSLTIAACCASADLEVMIDE